MFSLRLIARVRCIPMSRGPSRTPARSLYQTRAVAAAAAAKARLRMPSSRHQPTMQRGRNSRPASPSPRRHELSGPLNSEKAILAKFPPVGVDAKMLKLPKEPLSLYVRKLSNSLPHFVCESGSFQGREYWRYVVFYIVLALLTVLQGNCAHGEWTRRYNRNWGSRFKEGSGAAGCVICYSAGGPTRQSKLVSRSNPNFTYSLAQLHQVLSPSYAPPLIERTLSDGTVLTLDRAQVFMDFYCHKFGFDPPTITAQETKGRWEVMMFVDGARLGGGVGINKKLATSDCYLTVVANLDKSDSDLWNTFLEETKGRGDAIGLAPPVYVSLGSRVSDPIRLLCNDMKSSELYMKSLVDVQVTSSTHEASLSTAPLGPRLDDPNHRSKSDQLRQLFDGYMSNPSHAAMRNQRFSLPVHTRAQELLELVDSQGVTICTAATGSGKTTQIPQIILDDWIKRGEGSRCNIICTQPRRIAAISVAERVAKERGQNAGPHSQIGYQVRFDAKLPAMHGSVTFCTTGIFLKRMQGALLGQGETHDDRNLDDITHIIIDEVHERDIDTDLSLAVIKRLLNDRRARNKPLKVILMSATIDPSPFQSYFENENRDAVKVIDIPGRSFPVNKLYLEDILHDLAKENLATTTSNWVLNERSVAEYLTKEVGSSALTQLRQPDMYSAPLQSQVGGSGEDLDIPFPLVALTIAHVISRSESGHVLVFLPGWEEIQATNRILLEPRKYPLYECDFTDRSKFSIHLLHSTIPVAEQQRVFEPSAPGIRRIILATNIAETSITIPDVVYVVDTGKVKEKRYDPERHMSSLISAWVGSSNLNQRAGRAGRHRAGEYYGLVSKARVETLNPHQLVEMKRADLSNVVMHAKALDFPGMDVEEIFSSLIEPPAPTRVHAALETLQMVGALTLSEELTPLGRVLLQLPIDATLGRMVLYGALFRALDPALTLAAVLSSREPFNCPPQLKAEATAAKLAWCPPGVPEARSDPLAAIRAYDMWWALQSAGRYSEANEFCNRNFLNKPVLLMVAKVKLALLLALYQCGVLELVAGKKIGKPPVRGSALGRDAKGYAVPEELNTNRDSLAVVGALIAVGSQPNFAVRTSERAFRTYSDKVRFPFTSCSFNM